MLTMKDAKSRREAMTKSYSLADILKHAAVKEDVERQAQDIEKKGQAEEMKKVYQQKKPKGKQYFLQRKVNHKSPETRSIHQKS